jgi:prepilin peptidase CpaA
MESIIILVALVAAVIDYQTRKIPNLLTIPFMLVGLTVSPILSGSWMGLLAGFVGIVAGFLLFSIPYMLGTLGAGDVKLMMGIGAWMGPSFILMDSIMVMILGGIISLCSLMVKVHPLYPLRLISAFFFSFLVTKNVKDFLQGVKENSVDSIPYGIAILVGTVVTICYL